MVEKSLQLSFVGNWDFRRVERINQDPQMRQTAAHLTLPNYVKLLWEISGGGPERASDALPLLGVGSSGMVFADGVMISSDKQCRIESPKFGRGVPLSLFYSEGNDWVEKRFENAKLSYSVLLYREGESYNCVLLDRKLARSLLMRLYFGDGAGLKYFTPLIRESDLTHRTQIRVYRVDWEKFLADGN